MRIIIKFKKKKKKTKKGYRYNYENKRYSAKLLKFNEEELIEKLKAEYREKALDGAKDFAKARKKYTTHKHIVAISLGIMLTVAFLMLLLMFNNINNVSALIYAASAVVIMSLFVLSLKNGIKELNKEDFKKYPCYFSRIYDESMDEFLSTYAKDMLDKGRMEFLESFKNGEVRKIYVAAHDPNIAANEEIHFNSISVKDNKSICVNLIQIPFKIENSECEVPEIDFEKFKVFIPKNYTKNYYDAFEWKPQTA